MRTPAQRRGA
uniref:Uncharacterized protein n=1 Tax=Arundo donax TaxID=35708 RepID=A0A0A9C6V3_ARUDO